MGAEDDQREGAAVRELKVVPYCPRCGTALSSHELGQPDVYQDVDGPVGLRAPAGDRPAGSAAGRRRAAGLDDDAVDAGLERGGRGRPGADLRRARQSRRARCRSSPRRWSSGCSAREPRSSSAFPGASSSATRYEPPFRLHRRRGLRPEGPHGPARRLRHRRGRDRARAHRDRVRRGRLPARRAARADRRQPGPARRDLRRADRSVRGALGQGRRRRPDRGPPQRAAGCCGPSPTSTPTRTAGAARPRCSTTPSRPGTSRTSQIKDRLLASNETVNWHPDHVKHGRFGNWLEGNVDWALSRERYWGTPLPVWRCAASRLHEGDRLADRARRAVGRGAGRTRTARSSTTSPSRARSAASDDAPRARGDRRLVRLGLDAVRPVPRPARERRALRASASRPTSSARRSTRRAAGSTRCSRSRRCCSTSSRTATSSAWG